MQGYYYVYVFESDVYYDMGINETIVLIGTIVFPAVAVDAAM